MKTILAALLLALPTLLAAPHKPSSLPREPGAIYLEDLAVKPVKLTTLAQAEIYSKSTDGAFLGIIPKGSIVELVAVGETHLRVRGNARQGGVIGWMAATSAQALRPEFIQSLRQNAKRRTEVQALIEKNEVALNMTPEEVSASLGKAQKKTSLLDASGRKEIWEFIRYTRVPKETTSYDRAGRLVSNIIYLKVPAGKLTVTFTNHLVTSLEQTEGNTDTQTPVQLVPAPVVVAY